MKLFAVLLNTLLAVYASTAFATTNFSGKSEAEFTPGPDKNSGYSIAVKNTEYRFEQFQTAVGDLNIPSAYLYEIKSVSKGSYAVEAVANTDLTVTAHDLINDKKLWTFEDKADEVDALQEYFTLRTTMGGDGETSYRLFSKVDGKYLFAYSFAHPFLKMPLILTSGKVRAFTPDSYRFLAYHDNYWPVRDHAELTDSSGLKLAAVFSYASARKVIQKIAVFYDEKAYQDPSGDPDTIELTSGGETTKFSGPKGQSKLERNFPGKLFTDITVKLNWGNDSITIPLENDRLDIRKAHLGKFFKKLVEIPEKDWSKL